MRATTAAFIKLWPSFFKCSPALSGRAVLFGYCFPNTVVTSMGD